MSAPEFVGAHPAVAPEKAREIRRILETEFHGDAAHRASLIYQATPGLERQALLNQVERRAAGNPAAKAVRSAGNPYTPAPDAAMHDFNRTVPKPGLKPGRWL